MKKSNPADLFEFPCQYQFKAMGLAGDDFREAIVAAVAEHVPVATDAVLCRPSGQGTYQSVSLLVTLHSYEQLTAIYADMRLVNGLKMLL
ncbi:hypothetical protein SAMN05660420_02784 [Desulfuromusa kysingii]|uniref:Uncharacterized protein n=1 Tax=Desulfuromusa kysingii TaxID=37625 RepID=A0A1H4D1Y8_9BACT|nr:DUF493 domain-containing protein [Desulfuromusa kysingii]SEA66530.1 hypothetical protein SAMN05660420_02784 [Desulfuromusa kysingii]